MAVNLSALAGAGQQFFDNNGVPLAGGKLFSYAAGTTTPQATYTSATGVTAHSNPIILNAAGRVATGEIWLTAGSNYKFVLNTSSDVLIASWDNITGINGTGITSAASNVSFTGFKGQSGVVQDLADNDGSDWIGFAVASSGTGAVARSAQDKMRDVVSVKDFGAVGNGVADDTAAIQNALNVATGKILLFVGSETYKYSQLTVKANTELLTYGCTFSRIAASTTAGFTFENDVNVDSLNIETPGGGTGVGTGDKGVLIKGSNVTLNNLSVVAAAQGVYNSTNWAVEIVSAPAGTQLSNITIKDFYCKYFSTAIFAKNVDLMTVDAVNVEYYRTAVYLRDVTRSTFTNVTTKLLGNAVNGVPGENGLLLESSLGSNSCSNLLFQDWYVADSGEHGYRLGGAFAISNITFNSCISDKPGSSILSGNLTGGEWHGGCGFKVLGGNSTITEFHENIYFNNCGIIDTNITYGTYPAGHGVNNFTPFLIVMAKNVHISNCWTKAVDQAYCSRNGILFTAVDGLYLNDCSFRDINLIAINPYREFPTPGFPGSDLGINNVIINGGLYEVVTDVVGSGIVFYMIQNTTQPNTNWFVNGAVFKGGTAAVRMEPAGVGGSYSNLRFNIDYVDSIVDNATYTSPPLLGNGLATAIVDITTPWRPLAFNATVANGSIYRDSLLGIIRFRENNAWVRAATVNMFALSSTTAVITDKTSAINTVDKFAGELVWNNTDGKLYRSSGALDVSPWNAVDASGSITPV